MRNDLIVLASKSPRRRQILIEHFGDIEVISIDADEEYSAARPENIVMELAELKLRSAICDNALSERVVIAADTIVWHEGRALGKPKHYVEAYSMLKSLSNKAHEVYSGFAIYFDGFIALGYGRTIVRFKELSDGLIGEYIATGSPYDKAGGYGIQDSVLVEEYAGDYNNVLGLPTRAIELLKRITKIEAQD